MRRTPRWLLILAIGLSLGGTAFAAGSARVIYSLEKGQNDKEIIALINAAKTRIYFAMYVFTLPDIADALVAAKKRGVEVRGLLGADESARSYEAPIVDELRHPGVQVETERHAGGTGIMHIKAMVTDSAYAVGSYNWTRSATAENDELLEIGTDPAMVGAYERILKRLLDRYGGNRVGPQRAAASCPPSPRRRRMLASGPACAAGSLTPTGRRAAWLTEGQAELLPVPYFHVVFTLLAIGASGNTDCGKSYRRSE